ncbi:MAG TPA: energy transducer TonB, partial [Spongiibacteraceae bacterium]|nr:energy transducer TonB [Spongiibacteraceae bacterium]
MAVLRIPNPQLPWTSSYNEDSRFQRILLVLLALYVVFACIVSALRLPPLLHPEPKDLPPQLTHVVLQKIVLAKPVELPKAADKAAPEKPKPVPKPTIVPLPKTSVPPSKTSVPPAAKTNAGKAGGKEAPIELMQQARASAAKSGVLQFRDDLAEMRENVDVSKVTRSNLTRGVDTAEKTERSLITGKASGGSGGINTAALSTNTGGIA